MNDLICPSFQGAGPVQPPNSTVPPSEGPPEPRLPFKAIRHRHRRHGGGRAPAESQQLQDAVDQIISLVLGQPTQGTAGPQCFGGNWESCKKRGVLE